MAKSKEIPGWLGPIVGPMVGCMLALHSFSASNNGLNLAAQLAIGGGLGLAAGLLVWWQDVLKNRITKDDVGIQQDNDIQS